MGGGQKYRERRRTERDKEDLGEQMMLNYTLPKVCQGLEVCRGGVSQKDRNGAKKRE